MIDFVDFYNRLFEPYSYKERRDKTRSVWRNDEHHYFLEFTSPSNKPRDLISFLQRAADSRLFDEPAARVSLSVDFRTEHIASHPTERLTKLFMVKLEADLKREASNGKPNEDKKYSPATGRRIHEIERNQSSYQSYSRGAKSMDQQQSQILRAVGSDVRRTELPIDAGIWKRGKLGAEMKISHRLQHTSI